MNFVGTGVRLTPEDIERGAERIGCEVAALKAVLHVEARGKGFDADNRPVILFEPHVLYRNLSGGKRHQAVAERLAYRRWKPGNYPSTSDARYAQVVAAMRIDREDGLKAASWGLGQVLGENHKLCGFKTAEAMVERCVESEAGQLGVMIGFIEGKRLDDDLRRLDFPRFAYGYNGEDYEVHGYDIRLKRAYERFAAHASTAYDPLSDGLLAVGDKGDVVTVLQRALLVEGFRIAIDGDFGPMTAQAVRSYQMARGLGADGKVGPQTGRALGLDYWR